MREQRKQVLLPKLRFPEFRDAGEWEKTKLGDIGKFIGGGTPSKENNGYWEGKNPWISSSDISEDSIHDIKISRFITDEAIQETATKLVPANSILLVSRVGVGKLAVTKKPICTSQDFTSFTPTKDDLVFVAYYLKSLKNAFLALNQGMAIKGFTKEDVSSLEICLPNLIEQQKIAGCLTSVDELITAEAQKLDALKVHKKGLMQQLFPIEGETLPKLRFPEFQEAGEWEPKQLIDILSPTIREVAKPSSTYLALGIRSHGKGTFHKPNQIPERNSMNRLYLVHRDDLIVNITFAWEGAIAIAGDEDHCSYVSHRFPTYSFKPSVSMPTFFRYVITNKSFVYKLGLISPGGAGRNRVMNKNDFLKIFALLPSLSEQQKIADCLSSLDDLITAQTQKLAALKAHKKGLMQQLFPSIGGVDGEAGRGGRPVVDEAQG